jgi:hypothetical protein
MKKYLIIWGSILVVVLVVLGSFNNIFGYQTVQASNMKKNNNEVNQKDLLFQIIVDMANNKEIQRVILGSELANKQFFASGTRYSIFTPQVITKRFLNVVYQINLILSKTINKMKIHSILLRYHVNNAEIQKGLSEVIEKDTKLKSEMTRLSSLSCGCEDENSSAWQYPILCSFLLLLADITRGSDMFNNPIKYMLEALAYRTAETIHCYWVY